MKVCQAADFVSKTVVKKTTNKLQGASAKTHAQNFNSKETFLKNGFKLANNSF